VVDILAEDREGLPKGVCLEGQDDLDVGLGGHVLYQGQVATQEALLEHIARSGIFGIFRRCNIRFYHKRTLPNFSPRLTPRLLAERLSIVLFAARTLIGRKIKNKTKSYQLVKRP
jgi:hypothetical protein